MCDLSCVHMAVSYTLNCCVCLLSFFNVPYFTHCVKERSIMTVSDIFHLCLMQLHDQLCDQSSRLFAFVDTVTQTLITISYCFPSCVQMLDGLRRRHASKQSPRPLSLNFSTFSAPPPSPDMDSSSEHPIRR